MKESYKSFGQLVGISSTNFRLFNSVFSQIEVWFTYKNFKSLEMQAYMNLTFSYDMICEHIMKNEIFN